MSSYALGSLLSVDRKEVNQRKLDHSKKGENRDRGAVHSLEFRQDLSEELLQATSVLLL